MAFLVCYSRLGGTDEHRGPNKAIYLDQHFYELIYDGCRSDAGAYIILRKIALLRYKSPVLVISTDQLALLRHELSRFEESGVVHPQLAEFQQVCIKAASDGCALTISGDMYPELWKVRE